MPSVAMPDNVRLPDDSKSIAFFLSRLFSRIVRLVIGSVSLPALVDILKAIYVKEAEDKLLREGSKPTKSALALITGLDTRVVSQVLENNLESTIQNQNVNPENALIDMWSSDPYFQDPNSGQAAALPIAGRGKTFQGLVLRSIGRNITVKTVLDRLMSSGSVKVNRGEVETVELVSQIFLPLTDRRVRLTELALLEASRILGAVVHNMNSEPQFRVPQQGRWTYRLSQSRFNEFKARARTLLDKQILEGEALLEEFEEPKKHAGQVTVGIGWYQWSDHEPEEEGE